MKTAVDVHNFLVERDVPHEMVPTKGRVRSPERVAAVLGLDPKQVGRVALFEAADGPVAVLLSADRAPDPTRLREEVGGEIEEMPPERAADLTEFLPEALPPVALPQGTRVLMDADLAREEVLYFPGGEATSVLKIRSQDLVAAVDARITSVTE